MPALLEAHKLSSRAAHVGFDWPEIGGLFEKLEEETDGAEGRTEASSLRPSRLPAVASPDRASRRFLKNSGSDLKMKSGICFLCW